MKWLHKMIAVLASLGLLLGLVALISPLPVGIFIIAINLAILLCVSERARQLLGKLRKKSLWVNRNMYRLETKIEKRFYRLWCHCIKTRPIPPEHNEPSNTQ